VIFCPPTLSTGRRAAHAGSPCRSSELVTIRAFVPSACIEYKNVCPTLPD
jgi:hypothetical protein